MAQLYVSSTCNTIGNINRVRGTQQIHTSTMYLDINHPATCSGYIRQLHYCYHVINLGFAANSPIHEALVQIWREEQATQELHLIQEYDLRQNTSQDIRNDFVCRNKTLKPEDYIYVNENDVIGVTLPVYSLTSPLQLISTQFSQLGLYWEPLSAVPATKLPKSSLTFSVNFVLHLYASIGELLIHNVSSQW